MLSDATTFYLEQFKFRHLAENMKKQWVAAVKSIIGDLAAEAKKTPSKQLFL